MAPRPRAPPFPVSEEFNLPHKEAHLEDFIDSELDRPSCSEPRPQLGTTSWPFACDAERVSRPSRTSSPDERQAELPLMLPTF